MPNFSHKASISETSQSIRSKDKIANAIPLTLGFLLLLGLVLFGQDYLSKRKPPSSTIILAYEQGEQKEESDTSDSINFFKQVDLDLA